VNYHIKEDMACKEVIDMTEDEFIVGAAVGAAVGEAKKVRKVKEKVPKEMRKTYTVTFGDVAENHARNQQIGKLAERGHSVEKLMALKEKVERELVFQTMQLHY
jgi:uncharacterized protein (DUF4213/DUF364 family)